MHFYLRNIYTIINHGFNTILKINYSDIYINNKKIYIDIFELFPGPQGLIDGYDNLSRLVMVFNNISSMFIHVYIYI